MLYSFQALCLSLLFLFPQLIQAQQFVGAYINNSLPTLPGANLTFFNVKDAKKNSATFLNYLSFNNSGKYLPGSAIKRMIIIIHGLDRDPATYMSNTLSVISQLPASAGVTIDNTQVLAPYFPNGDDKNTAYPWTTGLAPGKGSTSNCTVWQASNWASGAEAQYPWNRYNISSYGVLDQIMQYYDNKALYPNLQQFVVAGHSLGGQMAQRYAAVGDVLNLKTPITYWVANPDSLVWFSADRPLDYSTCGVYDNWRWGFSNYTNVYGTAIVAAGRNASLARYNSRRIAYGRGLQDSGDDSSTCSPSTTGGNRNERFFAFIKSFPPSASHTIDYANCGHDYPCMALDPGGMARIFFDNYNGNATAYDQGCPRMQAGDDPFPNPSCGILAPVTDAGTYNGYNYSGCYTDTAGTLSYKAYDSPNNTIQMCTAACAAQGYSVAGMEFATQCFCGNYLAASVKGPLVEAACGMSCAANSSQTCGDAYRLSIFSIGAPTVLVAPSMPAMIGTYAYEGCFTEASSGRALGGISTSSSNMSAENCVAFCSAYYFAGMEYSSECYCGNSLGPGSNLTASTDCKMTCSGNPLEYCGGPSRLNIYMSNSTTVPVTSSATITSIAPTSTATGTSLTCPSSDGVVFNNTASGTAYVVQCYLDHSGGDLASTQAATLDACIQACDNTAGCLGAAYVNGACYMKSVIGASLSNNAVWGFVRNGSTTATSSIMTGTPIATATSSTTSSAVATSLSCPSSNGAVYNNTASGSGYVVQCYVDHAGGDLSSTGATNLEACIQACDKTASCIAASWVPGTCYMKSAINAAVTNNAVWGFVLNGTSSSTSTSTSTAATAISTTSTSATAAATTLSCPASNGAVFAASNTTNFLVECYADHNGGDLASVSSPSLDACLTTCANTANCMAVAWIPGSPGPCYMKSQINSINTNNGVWGAKVTKVAATSSASSTVVPTSSSVLVVSSNTITSTVSTSLTSSVLYTNTTTVAPMTSSLTSSALYTSTTTDAPLTSWSTSSILYTNTTTAAPLTSSSSAITSSSSSSVASSTPSATPTSSTTTEVPTSASSSTSSLVLTSVANTTTVTMPSSSSSATFLTTSDLSTSSSPSSAVLFTTFADTTSIVVTVASASSSVSMPTSSSSSSSTPIVSSTSSSLSMVANSTTSLTSSTSSSDMSTTSVASSTSSSDMSTSSAAPSTTTSSLILSSSSTMAVPSNSTTYSAVSSSVQASSSTIIASSNNSSAVSTSSSTSSSVVSSSSSTSSSATLTSTSTSTLPTVSSTTSSSLTSSSLSVSSSAAISSTFSATSTSSAPSTSSITSIASSTSTISSSTMISSSSTTPSSSSTTTSSASSASLPTGFSSLGCYIDGSTRTLPIQAYSNSSNTPAFCAQACRSAGYQYSGTEYGAECWCGNSLTVASVATSQCNTACAGDKTQNCGAGFRLSVVSDTTFTAPVFVARQTYSSWNIMACYTDSTSSRTLPIGVGMTGGSANATIANCLSACAAKGYTYCGAEYYAECYGSVSAPNVALALAGNALSAGCTYPCTGNKTESCGGGNKVLVYINNGTKA